MGQELGQGGDLQGARVHGAAVRIGVLGNATGPAGQAREISQSVCANHVWGDALEAVARAYPQSGPAATFHEHVQEERGNAGKSDSQTPWHDRGHDDGTESTLGWTRGEDAADETAEKVVNGACSSQTTQTKAVSNVRACMREKHEGQN